MKLGGPKFATAREQAVRALRLAADRHAANVPPVIQEVRRAGATTLRDIADALNARGVSTPRGGQWHFYPTDPQPRRRYFDGPLALGVQQAVGENAEVVPGFTSISCDGVVHHCVAYFDKQAKRNGQPVNERGLRREDETIADWLNGNVVVVCSNEPLEPK